MKKGTEIRLSDLCDRIVESVRPGSRPESIYLGLEHVPTGRFLPRSAGEAKSVRSTTSAFQAGDVLYGKLGPYLDKAVIAASDGVSTTELLVLRPKAGIDPKFLASVLHAPDFIEFAVAGTTGTTHPRTSWAHIAAFPLPRFSARSRRVMSEVVWLVHEAIDATEKAISSGTTVRTEAMRHLFTRGLRREPTKETEIGPIPRSWRVGSLASLCQDTDLVDVRRESDRKIEYVDVSSIDRDFNRIRSTSTVVLGSAPSRARKRIRTGDVIFATVRPTLLRVATVPPRLDDQVCSTAFCVLRRAPAVAVHDFIFYLVQRREHITRLAAVERGANYPAVTDRTVKEQLVPIPGLDEQEEIVELLGAIDLKIDLHRRKKVVLEQLFRTLLHDLMTGRIRADDLELPDIGTDTGANTTHDGRE